MHPHGRTTPPLWDPRFEHASCGLGALIRLDGRQTHELLQRATRALRGLEHRGATGADPETGDGAGIMVQLPDRFLRLETESLFGRLPEPGGYGAGLVFLPRDSALRLRCEELCVRVCAEEGHRALGFRDVPVDSRAIGELARSCEPVVRQLFVERRSGGEDEFERKLYVIRRRIERLAQAAGVPEADFMIVSLSSRRLVYKGLLKATQLEHYYPDLVDPRFETALAVVHSRFSTNTLGTWDLAHPFNLLAHNGEINTVRGNASWLAARQPQLRSEALGADLQKLYPIAEERWSDSAKLDAALELLVMSGRSLEHAVTMLVPPAWTDPSTDLADDVRRMCEYHASVMEPWDGPAAIVASDGVKVVAALDRNGLRPSRYVRTRDGVVAVASEIGVLDADPAEIVECDRVEPGRLLVADTVSGRLIGSHEARRALARSRPYGAWLARHQMHIDDLPMREVSAIPLEERTRLLHTFGYTAEQIELVIEPLADGAEPVGSMGDDTPVTALAEGSRMLSDHFRQQFAQVTNPPIDPRREALVMSLQTSIGAIGNLLDERPEYCRRVVLPTPVLTRDALERLRAIERSGFSAITLPATYPIAEGADGLARAVDSLCRTASRAAWDGYAIVVLSDREIDADHAPIPALLATAAVHSHLVREGARTMCGLVVESGEPRETMHVALLLGYGAAAVCPYLALETLEPARQQGFVKAVGDGLLKICSKMGISTIQSYRGAQIFEAVGLGPRLIDRYFPGTVSRIGGIEIVDVHEAQLRRHDRAYGPPTRLDGGGEYRFRVGGVHHRWNPDTIVALQRAVRDRDPAAFERFSQLSDTDGSTLRSRLEPGGLRPPVPLDEVEPETALVKRFATGAMSLGSLSSEAHETLAIAMNRMGGRSNTGEGGEDPARSTPDANGDLRRSAIKQVASARFGVTAAYLVDADQLQIKVAQGAKPGEGGQLPGHKVDATIARLRHSTPGVALISPPPHHDIYSIEDLAQLIYDLRMVNPSASISVKLVSGAGVGTIAAGVAKAGADHIVIAGHDGGTGASPLSSLKHAGVPWELGIAETQQVLAANDLRDRVRLQVDGGLRTARDIVIAALLGAEEFAFSTAPLVAAGCVMMRVCHLNTCPVGIATQDPELRRRFTGTPDHVVTYFMQLASGVRQQLAELGARSLDEIVGRADLLQELESSLDLSALIHPAPGRSATVAAVVIESLDAGLLPELEPAMAGGPPIVLERPVSNTDRSVGAFLAGEIARRGVGLPADQITLRLVGHAGQSLAAWAPTGLRIDLEGACNDYAGKGMCGGTLTVRPFERAGYAAERSVLVGNTVLYGATGGHAYLRGCAGERFAVRNSGATAVVEGVGDHGCEYMTGGVVLILGRVGRNFAAGMTGGVAYVFDPGGELPGRLNPESVDLEPLDAHDLETVIDLLHRHFEATASPVATRILAGWAAGADSSFFKAMPRDVQAVRARVESSTTEVVGA